MRACTMAVFILLLLSSTAYAFNFGDFAETIGNQNGNNKRIFGATQVTGSFHICGVAEGCTNNGIKSNNSWFIPQSGAGRGWSAFGVQPWLDVAAGPEKADGAPLDFIGAFSVQDTTTSTRNWTLESYSAFPVMRIGRVDPFWRIPRIGIDTTDPRTGDFIFFLNASDNWISLVDHIKCQIHAELGNPVGVPGYCPLPPP